MVHKKIKLNQLNPGDCILFATADWDEPYWTNKQHCTKELIKLGWRVLYIESVGLRAPNPKSKKDLKRLLQRFRKGLFGFFFGAIKREERLWVLSPLVIPGAHGNKWLGSLNQLLLKWSLNRHIRSHGFTCPMLWTYHPLMIESTVQISYRSVVYHCVDDLSEMPGIDIDLFIKAENELLEYASIVFVTSTTLEKKFLNKNRNVYFHSNVVDFEHFSQIEDKRVPDDISEIPEPKLIYHGVLSDFKIDFKLLLDVAKKRPNYSIVLIGEEREGQDTELLPELRRTANVYMLGFKAYSELPRYLINANIGLLPSKINGYTKSMFPMKYYEYIAAGLPIVSTPLEFTKSHQQGLLVGNNLCNFVSAIDLQLSRGRLSTKEAESIVGDNTWAKRMQKMLLLINEAERRFN